MPNEATSEHEKEAELSDENKAPGNSQASHNDSQHSRAPHAEKARKGQSCCDSCRLCGIGSSCKFYHQGIIVRCFHDSGLIYFQQAQLSSAVDVQ